MIYIPIVGDNQEFIFHSYGFSEGATLQWMTAYLGDGKILVKNFWPDMLLKQNTTWDYA